jgi:hypothetical protein
MTLECKIMGEPSVDVLREPAEFLRQQWQLAATTA